MLEDLVEVKLKVDDKVVKETLSRMGIPNKKEKIIYPSCYLYDIEGKKFIVHFKRLFLIERESAYENISKEDLERRNAIVYCLKNWGLVDVVDPSSIEPHNKFVFVLSHKEKSEWQITHKYNVNAFNKEEQ